MSITQFLPLGRSVVQLVSRSVIDFVVGGGTATARLQYNRNGTVTTIGTPAPAIDAAEWVIPKTTTVGDGWEIRADYVSGPALTAGDPTDVWRPLTTSVFWERSTNAVSPAATVLDLRLRRVGSTFEYTAQVSIDASSEP